MISGRDALNQIEQAISGLRDDENRLDAALASATQDAERLRVEQADAYRALAHVRLDTLAGDRVSGTLDRAEREALKVLAEKRAALEEIVQRRAEATKSLKKAQAGRHETAGRLEDVIARMDELRAKTQTRLANDPVWRAADAAVRDAEEIAEKADAKADQAEADRKTKGVPYEADRLFMYLWANGFGTSKYAAGAFTRFFDRKVAKVCGFIEARPNYAMLLEIPLRLREHSDRKAAAVGEVTAKRTAIERAALEADGIVALEAEFARIKAEIDAGNAGIASVQSDLTALDASHGALVSGDDPEIARAMEGVAESLASTDIQTLWAQAYATPTPEDEKIVQRIEHYGRAIAHAESEVAATRASIRETARRRGELEDTRERFRKAGYDRPGVAFNNESMLGNIIGGIIGGIISSPELWRVILGGYQAPHRRGGFGGDWGGGGSWGGGGGSWGGGGSSGGFGGDGGGFSTGGGFGGDSGSDTGGGF
jgi:DNA repair exonuclease SbcCD ATPase subunit